MRQLMLSLSYSAQQYKQAKYVQCTLWLIQLHNQVSVSSIFFCPFSTTILFIWFDFCFVFMSILFNSKNRRSFAFGGAFNLSNVDEFTRVTHKISLTHTLILICIHPFEIDNMFAVIWICYLIIDGRLGIFTNTHTIYKYHSGQILYGAL